MFKNISVVGWLAIIAIVLGFGAIFFGNPYDQHRVTVDTRELARLVEQESDHVSATQVAKDIIAKQVDYQIIDLRSPDEFAKGSIPGAINMSVTDLMDYDADQSQKLVLYSSGGIHAAQAWFLMKAKGFENVYSILDGYRAWGYEVLNPEISDKATPEELAAFEERKAMSEYFGGTPRVVSSDGVTYKTIETTTTDLPTVKPKVQETVQPVAKKRREGC